jgi:hypothetical protein
VSKYDFEQFGISDAEIEAAVREDAEVDSGLNEFMEDEVVPYWQARTPLLKDQPGADKRRPGAAKASVKVTKRARGGEGEVAMTSKLAHMLEHGTAGRTPTPEFAPGQQTASHFGGTIEDSE